MAAAEPSPLPYAGDDFQRLERLGEAHERREFWADRSGRNRYRINRLGFRGADFAPERRHRVFVFGESHAFGQGLQLHDSWPMLLAAHHARTRSIDRADVCVMNFAEPGASNALVARLVLSQCERVRPDLVLIHFAEVARAEGSVAARPVRVGRWFDAPFVEQQVRCAPAVLRPLAEQWRACGRAFVRYRTDDGDLADTLRQLHLVRAYLHVRGIPAIATCDDFDRIRSTAMAHAHPLQPLAADLLAGGFLARQTLAAALPTDDRAADGSHLSRAHHRAFADTLAATLPAAVPTVPLAPTATPPLVLGDAVGPWIDERTAGQRVEHLARPTTSNARIVRELLTRCRAARPARVLVQFADHLAHEGFDGDGPFDIPAHPAHPAHGWFARMVDERKRRARAFHEFAQETARALETLRCVLAVQYVCKALAIPALARCRTFERLWSDECLRNDALRPLLDQVDPAFLLDLA